MCIVSMVGDYWKDRLPEVHPWVQPAIGYPSGTTNYPTYPGQISAPNAPSYIPPIPQPTREEFEALKKEVEHLKALLIQAKIYDEKTGQPDCELDEKIALIKRVAELVGVNMDEVFKERN